MSILYKSNIKMDWLLGYVGLTKNWLSPKEFLQEINLEDYGNLDDDTIVELYISEEESTGVFLNLVKRIGVISQDAFRSGLWVWSIAYLNDIFNSDKSVSEKLKDIAYVWSMVDYPEEWKRFIYYMPAPSGGEIGEGKVYDRFVEFLEGENNRLRYSGYLK